MCFVMVPMSRVEWSDGGKSVGKSAASYCPASHPATNKACCHGDVSIRCTEMLSSFHYISSADLIHVVSLTGGGSLIEAAGQAHS